VYQGRLRESLRTKRAIQKDMQLPAESVVFLWRIPLVQDDAVVARMFHLLSKDERQRAARFHFERDRRRFVVTRGAVRSVLAGCLDAPAGSLSFTYGERGKPAVVSPPGLPAPAFNVSHSGDLALCAVASDGEIGVDVEELRPVRDALQIAARFFSAREEEAVRHASEKDRPGTFYRIWTRKESYLKAKATGIGAPLNRFSVSTDDKAARLVEVEWDSMEAQRWRLTHLEPAPGYVGALATPFESGGLEWRDWTAE